MWLLLLEAGFAGCLLIFIVWWTMYSGPKAQRPPPRPLRAEPKKDEPE
jgi:hypothetical protein